MRDRGHAWNSFDMVGRSGSLGAGTNADNFGVRLETSKVIKNRLKSALVAEISRIKVPKEGNLLALPFGLFHISLPDVSRSRQTKLAVRDPLFQGAHRLHCCHSRI